MKIQVERTTVRTKPDVIEHPLVQIDVTQGVLTLTYLDVDLAPLGFKVYAKGEWETVEQLEPPTEEIRDLMLRRREEHEERMPSGYGQHI